MEDIRRQLAPSITEELHAAAMALADEARAIIERAWRNGFSVERKRDGSFVTDTDLEVEDRLRARIANRYPEHGVLGEEFPPVRPGAEFQWIIDPIDGTEDFVHRVPLYGSILALHYHGVPLVGILDHPALDLRCHAAFGRGTYKNSERIALADAPEHIPAAQVRLVCSARGNFIRYRDEGASFDALTHAYPNHRIYRSCYGHTLVATGAVDAMVDYHDTPWDLAASQITVEEAGGVYRVIRRFSIEGVPICSAVFGKADTVDALCRLLGGDPRG